MRADGVGGQQRRLELGQGLLRAAGVVQEPAEIVVQRYSPALDPGIRGRVEECQTLGGPLLLVPGVGDGQHVQAVEGKELGTGGCRLPHGKGEEGHRAIGLVHAAQKSTVFEGDASLQPIGRFLHRFLHLGEGGQTVVEAAEEAERPGNLGGELGASVSVTAGVVGGLLEAPGGCCRVGEVPEGVEQGLADRAGLERCRAGRHCSGRRNRVRRERWCIGHRSIMTSGAPRRIR